MTAYPEINTKLKAILDGVADVSEVFSYPTTKIDAYPAVIFYPSSIENSFDNTIDNFKIYGYKLWIVVNAEQTTVETVFNDVMPDLVDAVIGALDAGWDFATIDGHRAWHKMDTGLWTVSEGRNGLEVTAEIDLSIKTLTS